VIEEVLLSAVVVFGATAAKHRAISIPKQRRQQKTTSPLKTTGSAGVVVFGYAIEKQQ
jgi:hypothetical protein